jgi:FtsH-binding integral membrane protein
MLLTCCRYLALLYAVGLAIGEAVINSSQDQWQYAPMWIIDYLIVAYLLIGFWITRRGRYVPILMSGYALSTGVMYIVFFLGFDPETPEAVRPNGPLLALIGLVFGISVTGLAGTTAVWLRQEGQKLL